jgi:hypothetical protein
MKGPVNGLSHEQYYSGNWGQAPFSTSHHKMLAEKMVADPISPYISFRLVDRY